MLCLWDVKDQVCLQSILIKFPFIGMTFDHGLFPLCISYQGSDSLLIAANDCIAEFKFFNPSLQKGTIDSTHTATVVAVVFIPKKKQVCS